MVENGAGDDVEPKPAKKEASSDVKPTVNVKPFQVKIPFQARIDKIEEPKLVPIGVVYEGRDTASYFTTNARWRERQELLDWVRRQGARAGFGVCIDKSIIKRPYLTMQCERSGIYKPSKTRKKPNLEGIGSRKCNCLFRLKGFFDKDTFGGLQCFVECTTMTWMRSYQDTLLRVDLVRRRRKKLLT